MDIIAPHSLNAHISHHTRLVPRILSTVHCVTSAFDLRVAWRQ